MRKPLMFAAALGLTLSALSETPLKDVNARTREEKVNLFTDREFGRRVARSSPRTSGRLRIAC